MARPEPHQSQKQESERCGGKCTKLEDVLYQVLMRWSYVSPTNTHKKDYSTH